MTMASGRLSVETRCMTGRVGHLGQARSLPGIAVLAAGSLLAALGLSACGPDTASAKTVVRSARAATLELAGGQSKPATDGMTVPKGATLRTAPGGSAALVAAGRSVLLGSATAVSVVDGEREQLRSGLVLIDARRAPGLSLDAGAATVRATRGGLARVERGALLRAVSYRSSLTLVPAGRRSQVQVDAFYQRQVPDGGLPGDQTALALTPRDSWERSYVLDLVTADADLSALADGLDRNPASSSAVLKAVPASYDAAAAERPSEAALAYVISRAAKAGSFAQVRLGRDAGGSWGSVAAIARADVSAVSAALDAVLSPTEGPAVLAAGGPATAAGPQPGQQPGTTTTLSGTTPTSAPSPGATSAPTRGPRPSPSASPDPVQDVVTTVTGLLPTASPTPIVLLPSPSPLVSLQVGGSTIGVG